VLGVSWGGGLAQELAFQNLDRCRKLILVATSAGALMVPGRLSVLSRLLTPRRYIDPAYRARIAPEIYGGDYRTNPDQQRAYGDVSRNGARGCCASGDGRLAPGQPCADRQRHDGSSAGRTSS